MEKRVLGYIVLIEQDEEGWFVATAQDIEGCYTQGKTVEQAMERIKEAIECCLEAEKEEITAVEPMKFIGIQRVEIAVPA